MNKVKAMEKIKPRVVIVSDELIKEFSSIGTATVHEVMGKRGAMRSSIKPLYSGMQTCGRALTVKSQAGDNLTILTALEMAKAGDVLVIDNGQVTEEGPWGEITTVQAVVKKLAGLVIDGSVRDSMAIKKHGFSVFCTGTSVIGTAKSTMGYINHTISCGNVVVDPGDIVLGDEDGVVVIPKDEAPEILIKAKEREKKEAIQMQQIIDGKTIFEIAGYEKILKDMGFTIK